MSYDVQDRRIEVELEELVGDATPPDLSQEIAQRHARGDTALEPARSISRFFTAAVLFLGFTIVATVALRDWAQGPTVELEPFEMRRVFYAEDDPDLVARERIHLLAWLATDNRRQEIIEHPERIHWFNRTPHQLGGPLTKRIIWYPLRSESRFTLTQLFGTRVAVVRLFDLKSLDKGVDKLIELVPVDAQAFAYTSAHLEPNSTRKIVGRQGMPVLAYRLEKEFHEAYADWSERDHRRHALLAHNGVAFSAPVFVGRIYGGHGRAEGLLSEAEIDPVLEQIVGTRPRSALTPLEPGAGVKSIIDREKRIEKIRRGTMPGIDFEQLEEWLAGATAPEELPTELRSLGGTEVEIHGFLLPIDSRNAELVPSLWRVGFVEAPDPKLIVRVQSTDDLLPLAGRICKVSGTMFLQGDTAKPWRPLLIDGARVVGLE